MYAKHIVVFYAECSIQTINKVIFQVGNNTEILVRLAHSDGIILNISTLKR